MSIRLFGGLVEYDTYGDLCPRGALSLQVRDAEVGEGEIGEGSGPSSAN